MTNQNLSEDQKQFLIGLTNLASKQFTDGLDPASLLKYVTSFHLPSPLLPASSLIQNGILPELPSGLPIHSLPLISRAAGGVFGFWAIGGEPGVGKTALAWQISLSIGQTLPVLYYDMENGEQNLLYRTSQICRGNVVKVEKALSTMFIRESIQTLESDLLQIKPPALIVVDSLQKLPVTIMYRRGSLDKWIHRLEQLSKAGYSVVMVSEKNRQGYGQPGLGSFKETGEIEYSASFGAHLLEREDGSLGFFVVKNRNRPTKGFICSLIRNREKAYWFEENGT